MDIQQLNVLIRTVAETNGATQTSAALRGVGQQSEQTNTQLRRTGQSAREVAAGFGQVREGALSFVTALTGVQLGTAAITQAAGTLRNVIAGAIEAQAAQERTIRATAAAYGQAATQYQAFAETLSQQTGFTSQAILEAALSARTLSQNYALTIAQTQRLISVSADLARVRGIGVAESFERIQSAIRGEAEASEFLGLTLNATFLQQNAANGAYRQTFTTLTDAQRAQVVYNEVLKQSAQFSGLATQASAGLDGAMAKTTLAANNLSLSLGRLIEPQVITTLQGTTTAALALQSALDAIGRAQQNLPANSPLTELPRSLLAAIPVVGAMAATFDVLGAALERAAEPQRELNRLRDEGRRLAEASLLQERPELITSFQRVVPVVRGFNEQLRQTHTTLLQVVQDINDLGTRGGQLNSVLGALSQTDIAGRAAAAAQQGLQQIDARILANRALLAIEREIAQEREATKITDPRDVAGARAAQERIDNLERLLPLERARLQLEAQSTAVQQQSVELSGQQAQLELQLLPARQQLLALDQQLNNAQTQRLQLLREQAALEARQRAAPALEALEDVQAQIERNRLVIANRRGATAEERAAARRENRELNRQLPGLEITGFDAQRALSLQQRAGAAADIVEQLRQNRIRQQQATVQQGLEPGEAQLAALQAQLDRLGLVGRILDAAGQRLTLQIQVTVDGQVAGADDDAVAGQVARAVFDHLTEASNQAPTPPVVQVSGVRRH